MHLFNYLIQSLINVNKTIFIVNNYDIASVCNFYEHINNFEITNEANNNLVKNLFYTFITATDAKSLTPIFKYNYLQFIIFNDFFNKDTKEVFLDNFMKVQRKYFIIKRTLMNYRYRKAEIQINTDIFLNPINIYDKNIFVLFQNNKKYLFTITDLVNLINSSLGHTDYFFSSPLICKNPYNNMPFNKSDLYNIYFFMKSTNIIMPTLFHNFFMTNFSLSKFKLENEDNIREYAIKNYITNTCERELRRKILQMLKNNYYSDNIKIHKDFPSITLIRIMKPYLNLYLHSLYSTESNKKFHYEHLLNMNLKQFVKYNPRFGRRRILKPKLNINVNTNTNTNTNTNKTKMNDDYIPFINIYDNNFMNNHMILNDEETDSDDDSDDDTEDNSNDTQYTSDEDLINVNNGFIANEIVIGRYNLEE
jgi:hypothetical protein